MWEETSMSTWEELLSQPGTRTSESILEEWRRQAERRAEYRRRQSERSAARGRWSDYRREYYCPYPEQPLHINYSTRCIELQATIENETRAKWFNNYLRRQLGEDPYFTDFRDKPAVTIEIDELNKLQMRGPNMSLMLDIAERFNTCMEAIDEDFEEGGSLYQPPIARPIPSSEQLESAEANANSEYAETINPWNTMWTTGMCEHRPFRVRWIDTPSWLAPPSPPTSVNVQVHVDRAQLGEDFTVEQTVNSKPELEPVIPGLLKLKET